MRPALAALSEQQKVLDQVVAENRELRRVANYLYKRDQLRDIQIKQLTRGLAAEARLTGHDAQVRTAIFKRADEQNPAQPVPDPAPIPPTETTQEAETPEAYADVRAPGLVPGTNQDTPADAVTTTYTPGGDIPSPAVHNLIDVTAPIEGTTGPRPLSETKTQTDVRIGDPMNPQVAFPVNGPYANAQRTSSKTDGARVMAALRLAKLRVAEGMSESGDDQIEMENIVRDASLSDEAIKVETATLERMQNTAAKKDVPRNVVPRAATVRTVPNMKTARNEVGPGDEDAESIFLGEF